MENIRDIISLNLINLRKKRKLTQLELAERIKYSDKAISRWENGEALPDIETLHSIARVLEVPIGYFFEEHDFEDDVVQTNDTQRVNKIMVTILSCVVVWLAATALFVYCRTYGDISYWQFFIWAVPITCLVLLSCNKQWGRLTFNLPLKLTFVMSFVTAFYCHFVMLNIWMVFIIGALVEVVIIINFFIKPIKKTKKKKMWFLN